MLFLNWHFQMLHSFFSSFVTFQNNKLYFLAEKPLDFFEFDYCNIVKYIRLTITINYLHIGEVLKLQM